MIRSLGQMLVMAAIVTTALFVPVLVLIALVAAIFGVRLAELVTFAGALPAPEGLLAWWAILFAPALIYSAYLMPWGARE